MGVGKAVLLSSDSYCKCMYINIKKIIVSKIVNKKDEKIQI